MYKHTHNVYNTYIYIYIHAYVHRYQYIYIYICLATPRPGVLAPDDAVVRAKRRNSNAGVLSPVLSGTTGQSASCSLFGAGLGSVDSISTQFRISVPTLLRSSGPKTHAGPAACTWWRVCVNVSVSIGLITFRFRSEPPPWVIEAQPVVLQFLRG